MLPLMIPSALCDANASANALTWPKRSFTLHFDWLAQEIQWCHWCHWCHVMLTPMPMASFDTNLTCVTWPKMSCCSSFWSSWPKECNCAIDVAISIKCCQMLMPMASHAPHFSCLDISNSVQPMKMPLVSHGTYAHVSGFTWPKSHVTPHCNCLDLRGERDTDTQTDSLLRSPGKQSWLSLYISFTQKIRLEKAINQWYLGISWEAELIINTIVLFSRWSWKGNSSVTLGGILLCTFIVQVSWETELLERVCWPCKAWF